MPLKQETATLQRWLELRESLRYFLRGRESGRGKVAAMINYECGSSFYSILWIWREVVGGGGIEGA